VTRLFNSEYEIRLRILLLLYRASKPISADKITAIDFIIIYAKEFGMCESNLHGSSPYRFAEITARRTLVNQSIKTNVCDGMIAVDVSDGYSYSLTELGRKYVESFKCSYVATYLENAKVVVYEYETVAENVLMKMIQDYCYESLGGEVE